MVKSLFSIAAAGLVAVGVAATSVADQDKADTKAAAEKAAQQLATMTAEQRRMLNTTPITSDRYPSPPSPHYGPEKGSIHFSDLDPGPTIGGTLTMKPAVDAHGNRLNEADAGITMYMIHWGLEVGAPGTQDDAGAGDLGGDCMGFRDTGHVVAAPADGAPDVLTWEIPMGTEVPEDAVYFVGHTLHGRLHNLGKCTQTRIHNLLE